MVGFGANGGSRYCEGANLKHACKTRVAYVTVAVENRLVEEKVGSKGRKKSCGFWKTPWWSDCKQGKMNPCGGHQLICTSGVRMGTEEGVIPGDSGNGAF